MSIVASAFQYGCAPTLIPVTTMLISPPPWVNSTMRRRTRAIQSMFSVPLCIEIFAPADSANHSSGTCICSARSTAAMMRRHSGSASEPISRLGSPSRMTRAMPSGCFAREVANDARRRRSPTFWPYGRLTGTSSPPRVEIVLDELAGREVRVGARPLGGQQAHDLVRVGEAALPHAHHLRLVIVQRRHGPIVRLDVLETEPAADRARDVEHLAANLARVRVRHRPDQGRASRGRGPRRGARGGAPSRRARASTA